ncbi:MAG: sn-glycerol-3-phosphate ABC transporter permease UgpA [Alphaproteobacteria bacterium]|nr:sn-glycerol-3-phosphate ABC transporter permease UgpA [Alphaproteobacteria bacterium]
MGSSVFRSRWLPYLLLVPQLLILFVFFYWPAGQAIYQSVMMTDAFGNNPQFVGLENFTRLFESPEYLESVQVTFLFSFLVAGLSTAIGLLLALFVDRAVRGRGAYRTLLLWPYAVAPVIVGVLWIFLLDPGIGLVAYVLTKWIGIEWRPNLDPGHGLALVVVASVWKQISYNFIFFLAGLQAIPRFLIEQAAIDGAGVLRRTRDIVVPLLGPTTFFLVVMNVVYAFFETFGIVHVMTKGGPGTATTILAYKTFRDGFVSLDYGSSGAQSVILMILVILLTLAQFRLVERKVHYAS